MSDRHQILADREFWTRLEYAASRRLENSDDKGLRRFWIDGFIPETATDTKFGLDVEGVAWVGDGPRTQQQYRFVASLPQKMLHRKTPTFAIEELSLDEGHQAIHLLLANRASGTEPCAAPNGGPATRLGNSNVTEGPPSVS